MLWIKSTTGRGASLHAEPYRPSDTYDTKQKCEAWVRGTIQFMIDNRGNSRVTSLGNDVRTQDPVYGDSHYEYLCLPDTVDPRGPKGK